MGINHALGDEKNGRQPRHDQPRLGHMKNVKKCSQGEFEAAPQGTENGDMGPEGFVVV